MPYILMIKFSRQKLLLHGFCIFLVWLFTLSRSVESVAEVSNPTQKPKVSQVKPTGAASKTKSTSGTTGGRTSTVTSAVLSHALETKARAMLQQYIPTSEFHLTVNAIPGTKTFSGVPYDPTSVSVDAFESMTVDELIAYSAKVDVTVLISDRFQKSKKSVITLLFSSLKLDKNRGDSVTFSRLGIKGEPEAWERQREEMNRQVDALKRDNERLGREIQEKTLAAAVKDKELQSEVQKELRREKEKQFKPSEVNQPDWDKVVNTLIKPILIGFSLLLLGALAIGLALFFLGKGFAKSGQELGSAIATIGKAMEELGSGSTRQNEPIMEKTLSQGTQELKQLGEGRQTALSLPADSAWAYLAQVRQELLEGINETTESILLHFLNQMLSLPETVGRGVAALEIVGKEVATEMYRRLGTSQQESVQAFLHGGSYQRPKIELMLDVADELKTKFMAESFTAQKGAPSERVAEKALQLSAEELTQLALEIPESLLPRFLLYLEGNRIASLLSALKPIDFGRFEVCVAALQKLPEAEKADKMDQSIYQAMESIQARSKADAHRPFLRLYEEIVQASADDISDEVVKALSDNPRLETYFRENVITFQTFFLLSDDSQQEIVDSLSNKDLAALLSGLSPEQKDRLFELLTERRADLVSEELETLEGSEGKVAKYAFRRVKEVVVKKLRHLKASGTLVENLKKLQAVSSSFSTPVTASEPVNSESPSEEEPEIDGPVNKAKDPKAA